MFRIKICGLTSAEDARFAVDAGADAIGLNFYEKSSRYVEPAVAEKIATEISADATPVGLFVNHSKQQLTSICNEVGLNVVQLHGDESPEFIGQLGSGYDIVRARRVSDRGLQEIEVDLKSCVAQAGFLPKAMLLDAAAPGQYGGSGETVSWSAVADHHGLISIPLILAGGLTPENVAEAIRTVRPHGVDVASGVESSPGVKDREKIRFFIEAAQVAFDEIDA